MWQVVIATMYSGATRRLAQILFGELNRISCSIFHTWWTEQTPRHFYISTQVRICAASVAVYTTISTFSLLYADFCLHQWAKMYLGMAASAELSVGGYIQCKKPQLFCCCCCFAFFLYNQERWGFLLVGHQPVLSFEFSDMVSRYKTNYLLRY